MDVKKLDIKKHVAEMISTALKTDNSGDIYPFVESPPNPNLGDFAFPCFRLAKELRKSPAAIAQELAEELSRAGSFYVDEVKTAGGYINFFLNKQKFAEHVLTSIIENPEAYGKSDIGGGKTIIVEYSSPNIAKQFHVGHIGTTIIGHALYNIFKYIGYNTVGMNFLGDWGTQFGKLLAAYKLWGDKDEIEKTGIDGLTEIYVRFHDEAEANPALNDDARAWMLKMQNGDEEALDIWRWFGEVGMKEYMSLYDRLGISFDVYSGESHYNDKMNAVVDELREKGLLVKSDGAMIVDLSAYNMPPSLILRSDGGTLYTTRDIAAALDRKKIYDFDKCLILTAMDQNLHFAQWIKVVELMGYEWAKNIVHVSYGLTSFEQGKLSTRKGNVIKLVDVLNEAVAKTREIINEKNPDLKDKDIVAEQVGIGAVIFQSMYNSRIKEVTFSWERMLSFDGETGPYVQYTHARTASVLEKYNTQYGLKPESLSPDYSILTDEASFELIKLLYTFPDKLIEAAEKYEPFLLTRHLVALAQGFNKFYHENEILTDDEAIRTARVALVYCVKKVIATGLTILGIAAPDKM